MTGWNWLLHFVEVMKQNILKWIKRALPRILRDLFLGFQYLLCNYEAILRKRSAYVCVTRGNVTHSATYEHFFPPLFFIFNLIFSRHPLPYYSLPPNTTQEQCFLPSVSWAVGWLRIQRGQRQARQRTQRSVRALPEVRVWRPVQNVSIVFCARQNIVKYYDDLQLCDW